MHGVSPPRGVGPLTGGDAVKRRRTFHPAVLFAVVSLVVVLDQLVKQFVLERLEPGVFVPFIGPRIGWQLVFNPGAAFGIPLPPLVFPLVTLVVLVVVVRSLADQPSTLLVTAQGLILGGALGNIVDRLVRAGDEGPFSGEVVDYVAWGSFARFNVADAAITVGVVLVVLALLLEERQHRRAAT
jgi:signal peptidase II